MVRAFKNKIKLVYHLNVQVLLFYLLSSFSADVITVVFGNLLCSSNLNIVLSFSCNVRRCSRARNSWYFGSKCYHVFSFATGFLMW